MSNVTACAPDLARHTVGTSIGYSKAMENQHPVLVRIAKFIEDSGHRATIVPADDSDTKYFVRFKSRGERFQVNVDTTDPGFLYVSAAYGFANKPEFDGRFWQMLIDVQRSVKAVKFSTERDLLVAGVEQFWDEAAGFEAIFWRCVDAVSHCAAECLRRFSAPEYAAAATASATLPDPEEAQQAASRFLAEFASPQNDESAEKSERPRSPRPRRKKPQP